MIEVENESKAAEAISLLHKAIDEANDANQHLAESYALALSRNKMPDTDAKLFLDALEKTNAAADALARLDADRAFDNLY